MFKGWRRPDPPKKKMKYDPNIVTFESSDESDETSASEDEHSVNNSSTKDSLNKIDSVSCIEDTDSVQPIEKTDSIEIAASVKDIPSSVESETNSNLNSGSSNLSPQKNLSQMEREPAKFVPVSRKREIQVSVFDMFIVFFGYMNTVACYNNYYNFLYGFRMGKTNT